MNFFYKKINKLQQNKAFTLAEVLITLGIIGIIAEITIPPLMTHINDQVMTVSLIKEMSVIQQAISMATREEGQIDDWYTPPDGGNDFSNAGVAVGAILAKYLKVSKNCGTSNGCFATAYSYLSRASSMHTSHGVTSYYTFNIPNGVAQMILADGSSLAVMVASGGTANIQAMMFFVDVNGLKSPNRVGEDVFEFYVYAQNYAPDFGLKPEIVYPIGYPYYNSDLNTICSASSSSSSSGFGFNCTAWVIYQGNLDYKYVDDLNWDTKTHK